MLTMGFVLVAAMGGVAPETVDSGMAAHAFALSSVRLLPGPFEQAMDRDLAYLLRLEPDRLLSGFRKEAGLEPKAEVYGGWETQGVAGHSLGHYLSACSMAWASTGDGRFAERVRRGDSRGQRRLRGNRARRTSGETLRTERHLGAVVYDA